MKSIRRQLTLTILGGFGLLLIFTGLAIYLFTRVALLSEFDARLHAQALAIMSLTEQGQDGIQFDSPSTVFKESTDNANPQFYELRQTNGEIIAQSESLKGAELPRHADPPSKPRYWNLTLPGSHAGRATELKFVPKVEDEEAKHLPSLEAIVVVATDRRSIDHTLGVLASVLALTGLLAIVITAPMVSFSLRRGHAPLEQLARQASAITAQSLETRFPVDSMPEELRPITNRLNDLLCRLEASFERERQFSADLAHELRTPLAELRAMAEVELAWPESGESEKHRETLNIALQMEAMVTSLLELARCENGKVSCQIESVPVAPLVREVWQPLAGKAEKKRLAFSFNVPADVTIQTDRRLFRSILANLLSNSLEYTPENGRGEIAWKGGELAVSNTVHDLSAADLSHLFERLWRKDKSRTGNEHFGLGLVLSQRFAEQLGLNLTASMDGDTLTMLLSRRRE